MNDQDNDAYFESLAEPLKYEEIRNDWDEPSPDILNLVFNGVGEPEEPEEEPYESLSEAAKTERLIKYFGKIRRKIELDEPGAEYLIDEITEALFQIGEPAVIPLIAATQEPGEVGFHAVGTLGIFKDKRAFEALVNILNGSDNTKTYAAAHALGVFGDQRAIEPLIGKLTHPSSMVRYTIVEALDKLGIGDSEVLDTLEEFMEKEPNKKVKRKIGEVIEHLKAEVEELK